ncbi:MAG: multicopper oxidase domain-containing protein [Candidatus Sulfotelmatobacter sp.]
MKLLPAACLLLLIFSASSSFAVTRHYYISAEDVTWNFAPSRMNLLRALPIPQPWADKLEWPKTRFIEYTDDTFTIKKPQPEWLGILGPIIRAEVGDEVDVTFLNRTKLPRNMHPHGLRYDKNSEGSFYIPFGRGDRIPPGRKFTYRWFATEASGPGPGQPSSIVWWYHAHVDPAMDVNDGLLGPIIVTAKGKAKPDGSPKDVDREFVTDFQIFDQRGGKPEGLFYAINGFIFGNLRGLDMTRGERVRWYLLAMGNEIDLHTPHWHGETVTYEGRHTDVVELLPGSMKTVDMIADNPGTWMFHCHVGDHMENGMVAVYTIYTPPTRKCPVDFTGLDYWNGPAKNTLTVRNTSDKTIASLNIAEDVFVAPGDLRKPYMMTWHTGQPILPGQQQTLEKPALSADEATGALGLAFFPTYIKYQDGSTWAPEGQGECFHIFWRDAEHPDVPVLPPVQNEINPD